MQDLHQNATVSNNGHEHLRQQVELLGDEGDLEIITAAELAERHPITETMHRNIMLGRSIVTEGLQAGKPQMLAILGECGIVDPNATLELMGILREEVQPQLNMITVIGRGNPDKPRTTNGFPGYIHMPDLKTIDTNRGLEETWKLLREIAELGMPYTVEMLTPQYAPHLEPLLAAGWIGSRSVTDHSQKKLAAAQPMPMMFKTGMAGGEVGVMDAINAMKYLQQPTETHVPVTNRHGRTVNRPVQSRSDMALIARGGYSGNTNNPEGRRMVQQLLAKHNLGHTGFIEDMGHEHGKDATGKKSPQAQLANVYTLAQNLYDDPSLIPAMAGIMVETGQRPEISVTDPLVDLKDLIPALVELDRVLLRAAQV